ncbi:MAG: hypothetical protein E7037_00310 [Verrucomicrobia bacterium]|nr:hypothetical protein [Verrucomicrobiota bacterium]
MFDSFYNKTIFLAPLLLGLSACMSPEKETEENLPAATPENVEIRERVENAEVFEAKLKKALADGDSALASYFAEYVLSVEELLEFVEKYYSEKTWLPGDPNSIDSATETAREIRYTLARRLLREGRWAKARQYFPEDLLPTFNAYVAAIQRGYNAKLSDTERARGFWDAALIVRTDGDALFLAAAGPTYVSGGEWEENPILKLRFSENIASEEERSRAESRDISRFVNDRRFRAAMLVQNAASLLPNNDDRTARLLCTAGVWLRYRDPKTADSFYKSVVIRCPQTEIGKHCQELRWFPPTLEWTDEEAWSGISKIDSPESF